MQNAPRPIYLTATEMFTVSLRFALRRFFDQHNLFQAVIEVATCSRQRRTRAGQEADPLYD